MAKRADEDQKAIDEREKRVRAKWKAEDEERRAKGLPLKTKKVSGKKERNEEE